MCAKNEEANIQQYLSHFLNQKYRSFEVVVVNDGSTDNTWSRLLEFQKNIRIWSPLMCLLLLPPAKKPPLVWALHMQHTICFC
ncbi:MAG: glycosyltransferase family 2 protein [Haliscomenobacter sp.]|nr:glycosyltransferase family 2 protein [Haliscomenobacter sp.]